MTKELQGNRRYLQGARSKKASSTVKPNSCYELFSNTQVWQLEETRGIWDMDGAALAVPGRLICTYLTGASNGCAYLSVHPPWNCHHGRHVDDLEPKYELCELSCSTALANSQSPFILNTSLQQSSSTMVETFDFLKAQQQSVVTELVFIDSVHESKQHLGAYPLRKR